MIATCHEFTHLKLFYQQPSWTFPMSYVFYKVFLIFFVMFNPTCRWFNQIKYLFKNYDYLNQQKMLFLKRNRLETRNYRIISNYFWYPSLCLVWHADGLIKSNTFKKLRLLKCAKSAISQTKWTWNAKLSNTCNLAGKSCFFLCYLSSIQTLHLE